MDFSSLIAKQALAAAYSWIKDYLKTKGQELQRDEKAVREAILHHMNFVSTWSDQIKFKDLDKAKSIQKIYVELNYSLNLRRDNLQKVENEPIGLNEILRRSTKHIVVLGQPGAGKTTTVKYICQSVFHIEKFHPHYRIPLVVRLRDLNDEPLPAHSDSLFNHLFHLLGLQVRGEDTEYPYSSISVRASVVKMVDALDALIVLDGLDEINPLERRQRVVKEFEYLCLNLSRSRAILTSRIGDYNYAIDNTEVYEIAPLTDDQIKQFAKRWLTKKERYEELLLQIQNSPFYDTAIRPLTMAHLCALYERYGRIPDKPKHIYKKIINLLIEDWDRQRMIQRRSSFAHFTTDRKAEFLFVFAYKLTTEVRKSTFTQNDISRVYKKIHEEFSFKLSDEINVIHELESQTGLFLQSGYDSFEFAHKSLQEYLTAEYIVKLPTIPSGNALINLLPNELAIATSMSEPSIYFATLVLRNFGEVDDTTVRNYLTRLIVENPDFRKEPLLGAAILYLRTLSKVKDNCDGLIYELIKKSTPLRDSIVELKNYYVRREMDSGEEEIGLHNNKPFQNLDVRSPIVIQINKTILGLVNLDTWK